LSADKRQRRKTRIPFEDCERIASHIRRQIGDRWSDLRRIRYTLHSLKTHREPVEYESLPEGLTPVTGDPEPLDSGTLGTFQLECLPSEVRERLEAGEQFSIPSDGPEAAQIESACEGLFEEKKIGARDYPAPPPEELDRITRFPLPEGSGSDLALFCHPGRFSIEGAGENYTEGMLEGIRASEAKYELEPPNEPPFVRDPHSGHTYLL
jgi:hypothetical protein